MEKFIGSHVNIRLKDGETVSGLLINSDENYEYVQIPSSADMYVVPKQNIKYYLADNIFIKRASAEEQKIISPPATEKQEDRSLSVHINGDFITRFLTSPGLDLSKFSDDMMRIVLENLDVQKILAGRRQKSIDYYPGNVYIVTVGEDEESVAPVASSSIPNSFGMDNSLGQFKTGTEMVSMLNSSVRRGNKNASKMQQVQEDDSGNGEGRHIP